MARSRSAGMPRVSHSVFPFGPPPAPMAAWELDRSSPSSSPPPRCPAGTSSPSGTPASRAPRSAARSSSPTTGSTGLGAYRVQFDDGTAALAVCIQADVGHSLAARYEPDPTTPVPAELAYLAWAHLRRVTPTTVAAAINVLAWRYTAPSDAAGSGLARRSGRCPGPRRRPPRRRRAGHRGAARRGRGPSRSLGADGRRSRGRVRPRRARRADRRRHRPPSRPPAGRRTWRPTSTAWPRSCPPDGEVRASADRARHRDRPRGPWLAAPGRRRSRRVGRGDGAGAADHHTTTTTTATTIAAPADDDHVTPHHDADDHEHHHDVPRPDVTADLSTSTTPPPPRRPCRRRRHRRTSPPGLPPTGAGSRDVTRSAPGCSPWVGGRSSPARRRAH